MEKSYFDGTAFEDMGIVVERIHDDLPEMREEMEPKPGNHGSYVNSLTLGPRTITLECRALMDRWEDFDALKDEIATWLVTTEDRPLVLRNHPDQHYMAHYASFSEGDRVGGTGVGGFEVSFTASDPIRYGEDRAYVLKSSGSFDVGGTEPPDMRMSVKGVSGGDRWTLTANGTKLSVAVPGGGSEIDIDCATRDVFSGSDRLGVTLDSDWPDFSPGQWRCSASSGTVTFSWTQRYR